LTNNVCIILFIRNLKLITMKLNIKYNELENELQFILYF
jgi:hypothetical protein